jgi:hypothetical protein
MIGFRIADTFTDSLARLTGDEQRAAKTTAFDLQLDPSKPGLSFHKLDKAKDKNFWSVRVNADLRIIVHRTGQSLLLCYVDHHDKAYDWAERRKLVTHPTTGAAQWVEIREWVEEVTVRHPARSQARSTHPAQQRQLAPLFAAQSDESLLAYGVPTDWLPAVRMATEDTVLDLVTHLPAEAAEALLELATGGIPKPARVATDIDPFAHPDAQRRFRTLADAEALEQALAYPWDRWITFLHPQQREWVERDYSGPARVAGSAGTGKTIVALHRAAHLARSQPDARVLLTTFSQTLANALRHRLRRLLSPQPRLAERLEVGALDQVGLRLYEARFGPVRIAGDSMVRDALSAASSGNAAAKFNPAFVWTEWTDLVDAWQLDNWEDYRDVKRLGRRVRLNEAQRQQLWEVFAATRARLAESGVMTYAAIFTALAASQPAGGPRPFDHVVVDEAQDLSVAQLRFLAAMAGDKPNGLFFAGDLGQRIFRTPFSWKSVGVDIRGRSRTLQVNYRTSHQIRMQADRLLGDQTADVDGNVDDRRGTVSVFNGPLPAVVAYESEAAEIGGVAIWLQARVADGMPPHEIGLFVRSATALPRAKAAAAAAKLPFRILDDTVESKTGEASICVMHLAKGLEFRAVAVMACDDEILPLQSRIESVADDSDLEEVYNTERHLLYVACTRARDYLMVSCVRPGSEFLDDLA